MRHLRFFYLLIALFAVGNLQAEDTMRDPTTPLRGVGTSQDTSNVNSNGLKLQAIMRSSTGSRAVINGVTCNIGSRCLGYILLNLSRHNAVLVSQDGKERITLSLYNSGNRETKNEVYN